MNKEILLGGSGEGEELHMNDVTGFTQGQIAEVAKNDTEKIEGAVFEEINLLSGIDEEKLAELKKADLVLVYRDNNTYRDMSSSLKNLVENKYGKKVYCISIPQGTKELTDDNIEILRKIMTTCNSMIDLTTSKWARIRGRRIPEYESQDVDRFKGLAESLEEKFIERGIDTVYIYVSYLYKDNGDETMKISYPLFAHGHMSQREDGSLYCCGREDLTGIKQEDRIKFIEDAKRFWKCKFPKLNVQFIEEDDGESWSNYKTEGSVLIADRHSDIEGFLGQKIIFAGPNFEVRGGIEEFLDGSEYKGNGELIAKLVMSNNFDNGDTI